MVSSIRARNAPRLFELEPEKGTKSQNLGSGRLVSIVRGSLIPGPTVPDWSFILFGITMGGPTCKRLPLPAPTGRNPVLGDEHPHRMR